MPVDDILQHCLKILSYVSEHFDRQFKENFDRQFWKFSGWSGQTVSEYPDLRRDSFRFFWDIYSPLWDNTWSVYSPLQENQIPYKYTKYTFWIPGAALKLSSRRCQLFSSFQAAGTCITDTGTVFTKFVSSLICLFSVHCSPWPWRGTTSAHCTNSLPTTPETVCSRLRDMAKTQTVDTLQNLIFRTIGLRLNITEIQVFWARVRPFSGHFWKFSRTSVVILPRTISSHSSPIGKI